MTDDKLKEKLMSDINAKPELDPEEHDGSYRLIRETISITAGK